MFEDLVCLVAGAMAEHFRAKRVSTRRVLLISIPIFLSLSVIMFWSYFSTKSFKLNLLATFVIATVCVCGVVLDVKMCRSKPKSLDPE